MRFNAIFDAQNYELGMNRITKVLCKQIFEGKILIFLKNMRN